MKRYCIFLLCVLLLMSVMIGCGVKEKIGEEITEGIINKVTDDANIDISDGTLTIEGEDGESVTFGETNWPQGKAVALIPEFKKGQIESVMNSDESCMVMASGATADDYDNYIEALKSKGFKDEVTTMDSSDSKGFYAYKGEEAMVSVTYNASDGFISIAVETYN